jgi:hypothetical protein
VADSHTCCLHPASSTHRQMTDDELVAAGISPSMVRLSLRPGGRGRHHRRPGPGAGAGVGAPAFLSQLVSAIHPHGDKKTPFRGVGMSARPSLPTVYGLTVGVGLSAGKLEMLCVLLGGDPGRATKTRRGPYG